MVGTRLLHLYQLLGEDERRRNIVERMRGARSQQEFTEIRIEVPDWEKLARTLKTEAQQLFRDRGPMAVLEILAQDRATLPATEEVRQTLDQMAAEGVGVFRQFATSIASAGERIIGHEHNEFHDSYEHYWYFAVKTFSLYMQELVQHKQLNLEHFEQFLNASWLAQEEDISYGGHVKMPNDPVRLLLAGIRLYIDAQTDAAHSDVCIPALDSLVLRFEAVLRKLARLIRESDTRTGQDQVTKFAGLDLLDNPRVVEFCGEDLITFAKHTLERPPEGLRDRVGHAILHFDQYRVADLDAVVLLILRFAALRVPRHEGETPA